MNDTRQSGAGTPPEDGLEGLVSPRYGFEDASTNLRLAAERSRRTCLIRRHGHPAGSGVLIGSDLILTAAHVLDPRSWPPRDGVEGLTAAFDYRAASEPAASFDVEVDVIELLEGSPAHQSEILGTAVVGWDAPEDTMDYAVLRLAHAVGTERGWFPLSERGYDFARAPLLYLVHYPIGHTQTISYVLEPPKVSPRSTRVRYVTNTAPGSSGAPLMDIRGRLVAIHHYSSKGGNQAVPTAAIARRLLARGYANIVRSVVDSGTGHGPSATGSEPSIDVPAPPPSVDLAREILKDSPIGVVAIAPDTSAARDWKSVLDGSPLSPIMATEGAIAPRSVVIDGTEMDEVEFLRWLRDNPKQTVMLASEPGEGKTSFLNRVAANSTDSHVFLRNARGRRVEIGEIEEFRIALTERARQTGRDGAPVVVLVVSLDIGRDEARDAELVEELRARKRDDGAVTVVIEGRFAPVARIRARVGAVSSAHLTPLGPLDARQWVEIYREALEQAIAAGMADNAIAARWPNLRAFLDMSQQQQDDILLDPTSPVIVRVIRAVYGADMLQRLVDELDQLAPEDRLAYFQICLGTLAENKLLESHVLTMFPGAAVEERSRHDPWVEDDGYHFARHPLVAQIVLQEVGGAHRMLSHAIGLHIERMADSPEDADAVLRLLSVVNTLPTITESASQRLRASLVEALRLRLLDFDELTTVISDSEDSEIIYRWACAVRELIPNDGEKGRGRSGRGAMAARLRGLASDLFALAGEAPGARWPDRARFARRCLDLDTAAIDNTVTSDDIYEFVTTFAEFRAESWWTRRNHLYMYTWAHAGVRALPLHELRGEELAKGRDLYESMFIFYEYVASTYSDTDRHTRQFLRYAGTIIDLHLPDDALTMVQNAIRLSIELGSPDWQLCVIYSESLLDGRCDNARMRKVLAAQAYHNLTEAARYHPNRHEILLHLALLHTRFGTGSRTRLLDLLHENVPPSGSYGHGYYLHALALLDDDDTAKEQRLLDAVASYWQRTSIERKPNDDISRELHGAKWKFSRIEILWRFAVAELTKTQSEPAKSAQRKFYQRRAEYEFVV
ncbi:trypsin-like peptidase domain-containing protein [Nocardia arizonensis]|uniref:trypsin-like peptidase domain-containing protein n=1 Tax=Nocardia arizonensis TaxID=1141647 RepID=UPI000ACD7A14|nr:trypsin-like peptidase domain-containing protein [Nocardia arizonensis]